MHELVKLVLSAIPKASVPSLEDFTFIVTDMLNMNEIRDPMGQHVTALIYEYGSVDAIPWPLKKVVWIAQCSWGDRVRADLHGRRRVEVFIVDLDYVDMFTHVDMWSIQDVVYPKAYRHAYVVLTDQLGCMFGADEYDYAGSLSELTWSTLLLECDGNRDGDRYDWTHVMEQAKIVLSMLADLGTTGAVGYIPKASKSNAKRAAKGKALMYDWTTVIIQPHPPKSEPRGGHHASPRRHQVRGHWATSCKGKKFWRRDHQKGDASLGTVFHDYVVKAGTRYSDNAAIPPHCPQLKEKCNARGSGGQHHT